jgi:hypothetical protein
MLGKGRAEAIGDRDIAMLADEMGVHPADLEAISEVESRGFGWFSDGRIKILFEKHWFYKLVAPAKRATAVRRGLARKDWISPKNGGYKEQPNANSRYNILAAAIEIDEEAAYQSISMGKYQIMGFNHGICGFISAKQMFVRFCDTEREQLRAFANFLRGKGLVGAVRDRDFERVEEVYNGGGLNGAYAKRMKKASNRLRSGKWKDYRRGSLTKPAPATPPPQHIDFPGTPKPSPKPSEKPTGAKKPPAGPAVVGTGLVAAGGLLWAKWEAFTNWIGGLFG